MSTLTGSVADKPADIHSDGEQSSTANKQKRKSLSTQLGSTIRSTGRAIVHAVTPGSSNKSPSSPTGSDTEGRTITAAAAPLSSAPASPNRLLTDGSALFADLEGKNFTALPQDAEQLVVDLSSNADTDPTSEGDSAGEGKRRTGFNRVRHSVAQGATRLGSVAANLVSPRKGDKASPLSTATPNSSSGSLSRSGSQSDGLAISNGGLAPTSLPLPLPLTAAPSLPASPPSSPPSLSSSAPESSAPAPASPAPRTGDRPRRRADAPNSSSSASKATGPAPRSGAAPSPAPSNPSSSSGPAPAPKASCWSNFLNLLLCIFTFGICGRKSAAV